MEPRTWALIKGFALGLVAFIFFFLIPFFLYNFIMGFLRDVLILYFFGPPEFQTLLSIYSPPVSTFININFGLIILLGLPLSVMAFLRAFYKSETVGHGLSALAFTAILGIFLLIGYGSLGIITFFYYMKIPIYTFDYGTGTIITTYLNYTSPFVIDVQGIINIVVAVILLSGLIYLVETGIGISNRDYWRYWSIREKKEPPRPEDTFDTIRTEDTFRAEDSFDTTRPEDTFDTIRENDDFS
ncbi:MAG: hypothetical protein ACUVXA_03820 [Candidatus Jordarchaeum sp.]|uniref:hypothetical protein n=1 Tax=Candidatus Jordarchaeum sp. TaxID=2823881 RepID=UPI004048F4F1